MEYSFQLARNDSVNLRFTLYNFVNVKESLKGQCYEIFDFRFFQESVFPKPLSIPLGPFRICLKIQENICNSRCTTIDTGGKFTTSGQCYWYLWQFATSIVDTGGKFAKVAAQLFFKICKFLGSICNCKSANLFWDMRVRKFLLIDPQLANPQILLVSRSANCKSTNFPP